MASVDGIKRNSRKIKPKRLERKNSEDKLKKELAEKKTQAKKNKSQSRKGQIEIAPKKNFLSGRIFGIIIFICIIIVVFIFWAFSIRKNITEINQNQAANGTDEYGYREMSQELGDLLGQFKDNIFEVQEIWNPADDQEVENTNQNNTNASQPEEEAEQMIINAVKEKINANTNSSDNTNEEAINQ